MFAGLYSYCVCVCAFRTAWVQKIKAASEEFIETEKKKREKAYQGLSVCLHSHKAINVMMSGLTDLPLCVCVCVCSAVGEGQWNRQTSRHHLGSH